MSTNNIHFHAEIRRIKALFGRKTYPILRYALRKHAYSNTLKILQPQKDKFQIKKF